MIIGIVLLVAAPLVIFLRANSYLNSVPLSPLPTFPIDDGYIYSNYVRHAVEGRWFAYQDSGGEVSGGVTSLLWYLLLTVADLLIHSVAGGLGVVGGAELAAYLLGSLLLASSAVLMLLLARLLIVPLLPPALIWLRPLALGLPPILLLLLTPQATWAALSGLELPLSMALVLAALYTLLRDVGERRGPGLAAALFAGLLPWARPELAAVGVMLVAFGLLLAWRGRCAWIAAVRYLIIVVAIGASLPLIYLLGTGRPLPSSFYAKTGQLAIFSPRFFQAMQQLWVDGGWPFLALFATAAITGLLALLRALNAKKVSEKGEQRFAPTNNGTAFQTLSNHDVFIPTTKLSDAAQHEPSTQNSKLKTQNPAGDLGIIAAALILHTLATSGATVWYGQMERYLLPVFPLALLLATALPMLILNLIFGNQSAPSTSDPELKTQNSKLKTRLSYVALAMIIGVGLLLCRDAATGYAIQVRNIADAHIAPADWMLTHTAPDTVVATEPVGALRLFSQRSTLDLVGLTTSPLLGHYRDWAYTWPYLHAHNAAYLLYYPQWFKDQGIAIPPWLKPAARFSILDNRIAGASEIVLYRLDWAAYHQ